MRAGPAVAGTAPLLRATLRHDGRSFLPWIALTTLLSVSSVILYPLLFPDVQDRQALALTIGGNPALGLIFGPAYDLSTTDGFNAWRSLALGGLITGLGAILIVVKNSRGQEDSGQAELLASGVLGREARLLTALATGLIGSLAVGIVSGVLTGLFGGGWVSSLLLSAGFTVTGWMFSAIAVLAAQIGAESRTASTIAVSVLGILFIMRGFLYSIEAPGWTMWINPLGWVQETRPASGNHWWPLLIGVAFTVVVAAIGFALQVRRDFGQGLVAASPGPSRGRVHSVLGLTVRLNRSLLFWACAFAGLGVVFGYFTGSVKDLLAANPAFGQIFTADAGSAGDLMGAFLSTILAMIGIIASIAGVQVINRLRNEELEDRAEPVLATSVTRIRYLVSSILVAFTATALFLLIAGLIVGIYAATADIGVTYAEALLQALTTIPAVWTVVGLAVAVIGARPQVRLASWVGVVGSFVITLLGPSFKFPEWAMDFSPFHHVPLVSSANPEWWGLLWISLFTIAFLAIGSVGFNRRDTP